MPRKRNEPSGIHRVKDTVELLNGIFRVGGIDITILELRFAREEVVIGFPQEESLEKELRTVDKREDFENGGKMKRKEIEEFNGAYILSHPVRAAIVKFLRKEGKAYISQIAKALGLSERLISFHLSMLSSAGFVESEYGLANPGNPPKAVRYYWLTPKVNETLGKLVESLK